MQILKKLWNMFFNKSKPLHIAYDYNNDPEEFAARKLLEEIVCGDPVELTPEQQERKRLRKERIRNQAIENAGDIIEIKRDGVTHYIKIANDI